MFTPISLYRLERQRANDFITKTINSFEWFIFIFYGESLPEELGAIEEIPVLAELADKKIAFIDFLPANDSTRNYLYGTWRKHCPSSIDSNLASLLQHNYELAITEQEREALEGLFYVNLFNCDYSENSFPISLAVANIPLSYMIKTGFRDNRDLRSFLVDFIEMVEEEDQKKIKNNQLNSCLQRKSRQELCNLFRRYGAYTYNEDEQLESKSIEKAFANFLDSAEDALFALNPDSHIVDIKSLNIEAIAATDKFVKAFKKIDQTIQEQARIAIQKLTSQRDHGLDFKKIICSRQVSFYRMKINRQYRIHFQGTPESPIFINIGSHKLSDYGYTID